VVVDVDPRNGAPADRDEIAAMLGPWPETAEGITGGGGRHLYFRARDGLQPPGSLAPGIDVKSGSGSYVVAPPSIHANGRRYAWDGLDDPLTALRHLPVAPDWVYRRARPRTVPDDEPIPEGQRNETLFRMGCGLRRRGFSAAAILAALLAENQRRCQPPLGEAEVRKIADSCARYQPGEVPPALRSQADTAITPAAGTSPLRIAINDRELRDIVADALCALRQANDPPQLFCRSGELVRVDIDERARRSILPVDEAYLRWRLAEVASFCRATAAGDRPVAPPRDVVQSILALSPHEWQVPPLIAITQCPVVRPDGTILTLEGYDPQLQVYYSAQGLELPNVPDRPTKDDLDHARSIIEDVIADFPFADQASKANTFALLLTPLIRFALPHPRHFPLFVIDSPSPGCGKTLLAEVVALVATGSIAPLRPAPKEDVEWRKVLTAALRAGQPLIIFDNLEGALRSPELAAAITANAWADRILGQSAEITVPVEALFLVTGINVSVQGDLPRRCVLIRLDSRSACPWQGRTFRHPSLERWVLGHRGELLAALLTLVRAWFAAGKPKGQHELVLASFREWSQVVGRILALAGVQGFLTNCEQVWSDPETTAWGGFLQALRRRFGKDTFTTGDVIERLRTDAGLAQALPDELGDQPDRRRLGRTFKRWLERRFKVAGVTYWLAPAGTVHGYQRWRVHAVKESGDDGAES
jgi:hypothetical protein